MSAAMAKPTTNITLEQFTKKLIKELNFPDSNVKLLTVTTAVNGPPLEGKALEYWAAHMTSDNVYEQNPVYAPQLESIHELLSTKGIKVTYSNIEQLVNGKSFPLIKFSEDEQKLLQSFEELGQQGKKELLSIIEDKYNFFSRLQTSVIKSYGNSNGPEKL